MVYHNIHHPALCHFAMTSPAKKKSIAVKYSLRSLFFFIGAICILLGIISSQKSKHANAFFELDRKGVYWGEKLKSVPIVPGWTPAFLRDLFFLYEHDADHHNKWSMDRWLSVDCYRCMLYQGEVVKSRDFDLLPNLRGLETIGFSDAKVSPSDLLRINEVPQISAVVILGNWFTDKHIDSLVQLKHVTCIWISDTAISNDGASLLRQHFGEENCSIEKDASKETIRLLHSEFKNYSYRKEKLTASPE